MQLCSLLIFLTLSHPLMGKESFLSPEEKKFLTRARQRDYVGLQAQKELRSKPRAFFSSLVKGEQLVAREELIKSLENAWQVRDDFEMQELFFQILERELRPDGQGN